MSRLVLSLFPGIGLLDRAFEEEGFCVVRGPDLLWGGDIRRFHPPAGRFDGVIGGPPCQRWSSLAAVVEAVHGPESLAPDLIPDFERVVAEAAPDWFLMENVRGAPIPSVSDYAVDPTLLDNRWLGGEQSRTHRMSFGHHGDLVHLRYELAALESSAFAYRVCTNSGGRRAKVVRDENGRVRGNQSDADAARLGRWNEAEALRLQGLPADFFADSPFTSRARRRMLGNGVPLLMGRAIAKAIRLAMYPEPAEVAV